MDWDKNGYVTPIEFKSYLAELKKGEDINPDEVYEAFEQARTFPNFAIDFSNYFSTQNPLQIDTDGSKCIHWQEFYDAMMHMTRKKAEVSEDEITRLFREVDLDGDGYISPKEAKRAYKKLSKALKKENDKVTKAFSVSYIKH